MNTYCVEIDIATLTFLAIYKDHQKRKLRTYQVSLVELYEEVKYRTC